MVIQMYCKFFEGKNFGIVNLTTFCGWIACKNTVSEYSIVLQARFNLCTAYRVLFIRDKCPRLFVRDLLSPVLGCTIDYIDSVLYYNIYGCTTGARKISP